MKKIPTLKIVLCGIFSALATIAFVIESLFPPLFLPGARMGISNGFILLSALVLGNVYGFITLIVKIFLGSLLSGNFFAVVYALPSGITALAIELLMFNFCKHISVVCISVVGAVINITIQNVMFCIINNTAEYLAYMPYLALIGVLGGVTVGFAVYFIIKIIPEKILKNKNTTGEKTL